MKAFVITVLTMLVFALALLSAGVFAYYHYDVPAKVRQAQHAFDLYRTFQAQGGQLSIPGTVTRQIARIDSLEARVNQMEEMGRKYGLMMGGE